MRKHPPPARSAPVPRKRQGDGRKPDPAFLGVGEMPPTRSCHRLPVCVVRNAHRAGENRATTKGELKMLKRYVIKMNERGALLKDGDYVRILNTGRHYVFDPLRQYSVQVWKLDAPQVDAVLAD